MIINVSINGTKVNPFHRWQLRQNPFPQIAKAELMPAMMELNRLGAEPIKDIEQIRQILQHWSQEFVELCCTRFESGKMVKFRIEYKEGVGHELKHHQVEQGRV